MSRVTPGWEFGRNPRASLVLISLRRVGSASVGLDGSDNHVKVRCCGHDDIGTRQPLLSYRPTLGVYSSPVLTTREQIFSRVNRPGRSLCSKYMQTNKRLPYVTARGIYAFIVFTVYLHGARRIEVVVVCQSLRC